MVRNVILNNDVHLLIVRKQTQLLEETGRYISMPIITGIAVKAGIDAVDITEVEYEETLVINDKRLDNQNDKY